MDVRIPILGEISWLWGLGILFAAVVLATVAALAVIKAIGPAADAEQALGLAVVAAVILAAAVTVMMAVTRAPPAWIRVTFSLIAFVLALFFASTNWTRRNLRLTAAMAVVLIGFIVLDIGRNALADRENAAARTELWQAEKTTQELSDQQRVQGTSRADNTLSALSAAARQLRADEVTTQEPIRGQLADAADSIASGLAAGNISDATTSMRQFKELLAAIPASPAATELDAAADAAVAANTSPPVVVDDVTSAIARACWAAGLRPDAPSQDQTGGSTRTPSCRPESTPDSLEVAMATMRLRLAQFRAAVLNRAEDGAAVTAAQDQLSDTQGGAPTTPPEISFADAISAGAQTAVDQLPGQTDPLLVLQLIGWLVLGVLLLGFWRLVERRSGQQQPGPVTIQFTSANTASTTATVKPTHSGTTTSATAAAGGSSTPVTATDSSDSAVTTDPDAQKAVFRSALLLNLTEPGAVPGANALQSLTDLAELPGVSKTWITPIVTALKTALSPSLGYTAIGEVVPPEIAGGMWIVVVRVVDDSTGSQVDVASFGALSDVRACRAAGYWAATVILGRSTRIPGWARWDIGTADALAAYQDSNLDETTSELEKAVALAPSSGILLQTLAARYDLAGRHLTALSLSARAVAAHPRYPIARYRLAASTGILAGNTDVLWVGASFAERQRVAAQLGRACKLIGLAKIDKGLVERIRELPSADQVEASETFRTTATCLYRLLRRDTGYWTIPFRALRRSERGAWWPAGVAKFGATGPRLRARRLVQSALLLYGATPKEIRKARDAAGKPDSLWQLSYNLSCYHCGRAKMSSGAINPAEVDEALDWLETALERPASGQMAGKWLDVDPDLQLIRQTARFRWIQDQLTRSIGKQKAHA